MQWFKHDSDAFTDAKIKKLIIRYGAIGYAVYFHCLELIASDISETNLTFELEHDSEIIADDLRIQGTKDMSAIDIVNNIMRYIVELGLFEASQDHIFCFKLLKRIDTSMTSNVKFREMITEYKARLNKAQNHDEIMIVSCKPSSNPSFLPSSNQTSIDTDKEYAQAEPSPLPPSKKSQSKPRSDDTGFKDDPANTTLYHSIYDPILERAKTFSNYGKEGNSAWAAVKKLKTKIDGRDLDPAETTKKLVSTYLRLVDSGQSFWAEITPSKFSSCFEQIWAECQKPTNGQGNNRNGYAPQSGCRATASFSEIYHED